MMMEQLKAYKEHECVLFVSLGHSDKYTIHPSRLLIFLGLIPVTTPPLIPHCLLLFHYALDNSSHVWLLNQDSINDHTDITGATPKAQTGRTHTAQMMC